MIDSIVNFILIFMTCSIDVCIPTLFVGGIPGPGVVGYGQTTRGVSANVFSLQNIIFNIYGISWFTFSYRPSTWYIGSIRLADTFTSSHLVFELLINQSSAFCLSNTKNKHSITIIINISVRTGRLLQGRQRSG